MGYGLLRQSFLNIKFLASPSEVFKGDNFSEFGSFLDPFSRATSLSALRPAGGWGVRAGTRLCNILWRAACDTRVIPAETLQVRHCLYLVWALYIWLPWQQGMMSRVVFTEKIPGFCLMAELQSFIPPVARPLPLPSLWSFPLLHWGLLSLISAHLMTEFTISTRQLGSAISSRLQVYDSGQDYPTPTNLT